MEKSKFYRCLLICMAAVLIVAWMYSVQKPKAHPWSAVVPRDYVEQRRAQKKR